MEGWDGTPGGKPSDLTRRRWRNFGRSGAKLIWGGEAIAVSHDARDNPNQLVISEATVEDIAALRQDLMQAHVARFGSTTDLLVGLQLTHSGRFSRPSRSGRLAARILYHHPVLDRRIELSAGFPVLTDEEIEEIIVQFIRAAALAQQAGFDFVDIKHCHGYLGHEFLSAHTRPGPFGGSFENRTRFLREVVSGIRKRLPDFRLAVRLSAFDTWPFRAAEDGQGVPEEVPVPYRHSFAAHPRQPVEPQLEETERFLTLLEELEVHLVNLSAGSPYYNPHIIRPARYPLGAGYLPPEDPLVGVARHLSVTARLKRKFPRLTTVGSAYTYLQEWLPHVAQHAVRTGAVDFVGLGRMMLSYPEMPADVLAGRPLDRKRICRTFGDCSAAPRMGFVSGCYRLDPHYRAMPQAEEVRRAASRSQS
jgi:2,4-dienoyl-CoA reductase-like NADH-dependent reductase (Old Yellow Enzyme family)